MVCPDTGLLASSLRLIVRVMVDLPSAVKLVASDLKVMVFTVGGVTTSSTGLSVTGLFGLSGSLTFEDYPMIPEHPTLVGPDGSSFPFTVGDYDGDGTVQVYPDVNAYGFPEYVPGGSPLTGLSGGYFLKKGLNTDALTSVFPGNTEPDFILEWHGVDGKDAGLGLGDTDENNNDLEQSINFLRKNFIQKCRVA
mgnify:CR=1 FL=1